MRLFYKALAGRATHPAATARMFLFFLAVTFASEAVVMAMLPMLVQPFASQTVEAAVDASLLTAVLAPIVWWLFIRPVQRLDAARALLLERFLAVQEEERQRMARDLHDGLGQDLTSMLLRLRVIEQTSAEQAVRENAAAIRSIAAEALTDLRRVVREARPLVLDDLGLAAAMEKQLVDVACVSGIDTALSWHGDRGKRFPPDVETVLYRVVQEAVTNAIRHSQAERIEVSVVDGYGEVGVRVTDNGSGFDVQKALHGDRQPFGMLAMRERIAHVGGSIDCVSQLGKGTTVEIRVPYERSEAIA